MAVGDVAVGEIRGRDDRLVGDRHAVVRLVTFAQALQDLDRLAHRGLFDLDRLEPAFERRVLLEVLAVLVERGGADGLQLAPGQHRLQDRGRVDRALGRTGTDERVQLVDEQDDVAAGADLLQHLLQALLEVAPVPGAGDQRAEVERVELLRVQRLGDGAFDDALRETLDDRGLADAGLTDQHRVVLGAPAEHLHHALDLALAPDDRVELFLARELREVAPELVEHERTRRLGLGPAGRAGGAARGFLGARVAGEQLNDLLAHAAEVRAELHEHLRGDAFALADQAEQDVLGPDVVVTELQRLAQRQLEHLLRSRREGDVTRRGLPAVADDLLHLGAHGLERDAERLECLGGNPFALVDQAEQDVLGPDVVVVEQARFLLGEDYDPSRSVGEALEQNEPPLGGPGCLILSADPGASLAPGRVDH